MDKVRITSIYITLLTLLLTSGCSEDEPAPEEKEEEICGVDEKDGVSTLSALINEDEYCPTGVAGNLSDGIVVLNALHKSEAGLITNLYIYIDAPQGLTEGTYRVADGEITSLYTKAMSDFSSSVFYGADKEVESSGTVVIAEYSDGFLKGTFEFAVGKYEDMGFGSLKDSLAENLSISEGRFNVQLDE